MGWRICVEIACIGKSSFLAVGGRACGLQRFFATGEIPVLTNEGDLERIGP